MLVISLDFHWEFKKGIAKRVLLPIRPVTDELDGLEVPLQWFPSGWGTSRPVLRRQTRHKRPPLLALAAASLQIAWPANSLMSVCLSEQEPVFRPSCMTASLLFRHMTQAFLILFPLPPEGHWAPSQRSHCCCHCCSPEAAPFLHQHTTQQ